MVNADYCLGGEVREAVMRAFEFRTKPRNFTVCRSRVTKGPLYNFFGSIRLFSQISLIEVPLVSGAKRLASIEGHHRFFRKNAT